MKKYLVLLAALCTLGFNTFAQNTPIHQEFTNLSAQRFKIIIGNDKNGTVLDLRTAAEMNEGYIAGAVQLDYKAKDAKKQIDALDKNKTYYIYCAHGTRSADASQYMKEQGFKRVYNLEKGFAEWEEKGFPVEKK